MQIGRIYFENCLKYRNISRLRQIHNSKLIEYSFVIAIFCAFCIQDSRKYKQILLNALYLVLFFAVSYMKELAYNFLHCQVENLYISSHELSEQFELKDVVKHLLLRNVLLVPYPLMH